MGSGVVIRKFTGGAKVFISLGAPLISGSTGNLFNPNFANSSLPDYYTRWNKVELSYQMTDPGSVANLTADDFVSIPMRLTAGNASIGWHFQGSVSQLLSNLAALTGNSSLAVVTSNSQIIRVISPHTSFNAPWPSYEPYIDYVRSHAIGTHVAGT